MMVSIEAQETLLELFNAYFAFRGQSPDQIHKRFVPCYENDKRALPTTKGYWYERGEIQKKPPRPGFLIYYTPTYATFRFLCDEEDYPIDIEKHKPVKIIAPAGRSVPPLALFEGNPEQGARIDLHEAVVKGTIYQHHTGDKYQIGLNGIGGALIKSELQPDIKRLANLEHPFRIFADANATQPISATTGP